MYELQTIEEELPEKRDKFKERRFKYKRLLNLLCEGHSYSSAARIVGYTPQNVRKLAKKPYFKRKIAEAEQVITGDVKHALVKRAKGTKITKQYQQVDKFGNVHDLEETVEIPGEVKAQLAWLSAKDKEGGWIQGNTTNIQINQQLQGVSTADLLLTLKTGGEGVSSLPSSSPQIYNTLPNPPSPIIDTTLTADPSLLPPTQCKEKPDKDLRPFGRNYDHSFDEIHDLKNKQEEPKEMSDDEYLASLVYGDGETPNENE